MVIVCIEILDHHLTIIYFIDLILDWISSLTTNIILTSNHTISLQLLVTIILKLKLKKYNIVIKNRWWQR
jgi:hypothetical protein